MKKFKLKESYYAAPTPKKWRKFGDALLAAGLFIFLGGVMTLEQLQEYFGKTEIKWILGISITICVIGKFLTNFFKEDNTPDENPEV